MRLLYVTDAITIWGGLERILVEKMNFLADEYGYEVFLLTANQGNHSLPYSLSSKVHCSDLGIFTYKEYRYSGLKRFFVKYQLSRCFQNKLKSKIDEIHPDILICPRLEYMGILCKVNGRIPLVFESHSLYQSYKNEGEGLYAKIKSFYYIRKVCHVNAIVALTEGDAKDWMKVNKNVHVIQNMVHLNRSGQYSNCMSKKAIFVGRFSNQKDIGSLLDIWTHVNKRHSDWELHLYCGYGELQDSFKQRIINSDMNIILHDPTAEIFSAYLSCSMLLLTSLYEPFGLVLPESMSCGLPVVAFDCPFGPADIISDGKNGFIISDRNISVFVDKVCELIEDVPLRTKMGHAAISSSQRYDAHLIMPQWKQLFEQLNKYK